MRAKNSRRRYDRASAGKRLRWLRSLRTWTIVGSLGVLAAAAYGLNRLEPYVRRINTAPMAIEWASVPSWLHEENWKHVLPELETHVALHPMTDPYDGRVSPYVAERLAESPWIARVWRISTQMDGRVKVHAGFRKPFAMVARSGIAYLVDDVGVRLPQQWASSAVNRAGWLVIEGVAAPTPKPGERWDGEDLAAGLKLARFLYRAEAAAQLPFRDSIRAIDVGNFRGRKSPRAGWLQLVTINPQGYINWGLPPGEEYGIEAQAEEKLANLCGLYASRGRLPAKEPIDVRAEDGIGLGEPD